jgi:hypothetical protein
MDAERARYFDQFQRALAEAGECPATARGRGVVTCGSLKFAPYLWILIRSLRHFGCVLPVELWHMDGEVNDELQRWFEPYGVTFRDGGRLPWGRNRYFNGAHGFKPYAVVHSSFREVLFLDADNSVTMDPAFLFETPAFVRDGAVFWSDPVAMTGGLGGAALRADFGLDPGGEEFESGQFLMDKARCWRALRLTLHVNEHSGYYYRFLFGDKETFRLAFDAAGQRYALARQPPQAPTRDWKKTGHVQYWIDGRALFHHRVGRKWEMDVTRASNHVLPHLPDALVTEIFAELRRAWPRVMPARERLRPYAGRVRRVVQPEWSRPYFGWLRAAVRTITDRERR